MQIQTPRRGTALIQVLVLVMISMGVLLVILNSTGILYTQTKGTTESSVVRNEARGAVHLGTAYLNKDVVKGTSIIPTDPTYAPLWVGDGSVASPYYMVLVGQAPDSTLVPARGPSVLRDTTGTFYSTATGNIVDFDTGVVGGAKNLLATTAVDFGFPGGGAPDFVLRVEYKEISPGNFYYEIASLARAYEANHRGRNPMIVSMHAALVPEAVQPWQYGMAGLNQIQINGTGTLGVIQADPSQTITVLGTNGTVSKN
ncbi:MAG: hypothetical protein JKY65_28815 [Planctomycetes bacterium]|nr:hypothetical protein [Planctomycetota bacterium]